MSKAIKRTTVEIGGLRCDALPMGGGWVEIQLDGMTLTRGETLEDAARHAGKVIEKLGINSAEHGRDESQSGVFIQ